MRLTGIFFAVLMVTTALIIESDSGGAETGVSIEEVSLEGFFLAVGDY